MKLLRNPWTWSAVLAVVAAVLGYWGYRVAHLGLSPTDAVFGAIQLFGLEAAQAPGGTPWQLDVARFLAPLSVALVTLVTVTALFGARAREAEVYLRARGHDLLIGLTPQNTKLAEALSRRSPRSRVVVLHTQDTHAALPPLRAAGVHLVRADPTQLAGLTMARAERASRVVVDTGEDSTNLEVAERLLDLYAPATDRVTPRPTVHVSISNTALWSELGRLALSRSSTGATFEYFNPVDREAQVFLAHVHEQLGPATRVELIGSGDLSERVSAHLQRRMLSERIPAVLRTQESLPDPHARARDDAAPDVVLICTSPPDAEAMGLALEAAETHAAARVFAAVRHHDAGVVLKSVGKVSRVEPVRTSEQVDVVRLLDVTGPELIARARHEHYRNQEIARGGLVEDNPSLVPWESLPESLKESNRRFAESVAGLVDELGGSLVPLRHQVSPDGLGQVPGDLLEVLAEREHERWMNDLLRDGWTYAPGAKDPVRKTHPLLVPWADLAEAEREKDRDSIRGLPLMLAGVGYRLVLPGSQPRGTTQMKTATSASDAVERSDSEP